MNAIIQLKDVTKHLPYRVSKSDECVNTIRHGLLLLKMKQQREAVRKQAIQLKTSAHIDNDTFVESYNNIIEAISDEQILEKTLNAIDKVAEKGDCAEEAKILKESLGILTSTFDECIEYVRKHLRGNKKLLDHLDNLMKEIRLYNIEEPLVLLSSNYGVPQNRERVVFIGCRNDQEVINEVPPTVAEKDKVKVYEALWDLNMVGNGETATSYKEPELVPEFESTKIRRAIQGKPDGRGLLFSEWSRTGRLGNRFIFDEEPFYVPNMNELDKPTKHQHMELFNHQTSLQNSTVRERLRIIASHGDYDDAKAELKEKGLESQKRNYVVLPPSDKARQSARCPTTSSTIPHTALRPSAKWPASRVLTIRSYSKGNARPEATTAKRRFPNIHW